MTRRVPHGLFAIVGQAATTAQLAPLHTRFLPWNPATPSEVTLLADGQNIGWNPVQWVLSTGVVHERGAPLCLRQVHFDHPAIIRHHACLSTDSETCVPRRNFPSPGYWPVQLVYVRDSLPELSKALAAIKVPVCSIEERSGTFLRDLLDSHFPCTRSLSANCEFLCRLQAEVAENYPDVAAALGPTELCERLKAITLLAIRSGILMESTVRELAYTTFTKGINPRLTVDCLALNQILSDATMTSAAKVHTIANLPS